ncbi:MAG: glycine zipper 2TM domain-containing protein [Sedimentisphaerales bacterium]|nr:glycine zipper 2TM domain-containing protein [Sedimentisphaerales bacterium]
MEKKITIILVVVMLSLGSIFVVGCESNAQAGGAVGALAGAGIGQLAGRDTEATLIGAAIGGVAGYMFGNETDKAYERAGRAEIRENMRTVAVNITNSNGSISQVRLKRHGIGYVGTRGEYYNHLPTEDELRPVYGF